MAEGPQVLLLTERLRQWLLGRIPLAITTVRDALTDGCSDAVEHPIVQIVCHGKHIFICFDNQSVLHNHLLMRGRWRKYGGGLLILPEDAWLSIDVGELTVCNLKGQVLEWISRARMHTIVNSLGPDTMTRPYPLEKIKNRLDASGHPVSESLLDQSLLAGIGNTAKSEILFSAGIDPRKPTNTLTPRERERLHEQIQNILWESYNRGGRWIHRVYRKSGEPCPECHAPIALLRLPPSNRSTYYCPSCQTEQHPTPF